MTGADHPSFLTLDRLALGADVPAEVRAHVESCEHCRTHLGRVEQPVPIADWARDLPARRPWWRRPALVTAFFGAPVMSVAILMLAVFVPEPTGNGPSTTAKGSPAVGIYVKHGVSVQLWDGRAPVEPGDKLRLKVVPEGLRHVSVFAPPGREGELPVRLHASSVSGETLLDVAWEVDTTPGSETLIVILALAEVSAAEAAHLLASEALPENVWVARFVIPKRLVRESQP